MAGTGKRGEVLYETEHCRVRRILLETGTGSVICKEVFGPGSIALIRNEMAALERLAGIEGFPRLATATEPGLLMLLDDAGATLASRTETLDVAETLALAVQLAWVVASMHGRGVSHRDISPANILLVGDPLRPVLIDFGLARVFAVDRPNSANHEDIVGTLSYVSPEQTGRTGRVVDSRSDLYSMGAVLYELLSGRPPFEGSNELQLIYDILLQVPVSLTIRNSQVPPVLAAVVARLLEKDPDRRYQSAEGLARDLERVASTPDGVFELGQWDFPPRLQAPSRLVGRDEEVAALRASFEQALEATSSCVLVSGITGVGKSALVNELRSTVAGRGGWFVSGSSDQFQTDPAGGPVVQTLREIGRLLLAEPEAELRQIRQRLVQALGTNAEVLTTALPEFKMLLGSASVAVGGDSTMTPTRWFQVVVELLRVIASPERPVVMVIDNLQWADPVTFGLLDAILTGGEIPALLVVGVYQTQDIDDTHPLWAMRARWERLGMVGALPVLTNLPALAQSHLLAGMLRLPAGKAEELAAELRGWTDGNPHGMIELVNLLRQEGVLTLGEQGWIWDHASVRQTVQRGDVLELLRDRISRMPSPAHELLQLMACLGGEVQMDLLLVAADISTACGRERLTPALEERLLILEENGSPDSDRDEGILRFTDDRIRPAIYSELEPGARSAVHLLLGRRLSERADFCLEAADQYFASRELISETAERQHVAELFRARAANAGRTGEYVTAELFLSAAFRILVELETPPGELVLVDLQVERHVALINLGQLNEADEVYAWIQRHASDPVHLSVPTCSQIGSLSQRQRQREALDLGLDLLARLGKAPPDESFTIRTPARMRELVSWATGLDLAADLSRPEIEDPWILAVERLLTRLCMPAFFVGDRNRLAWLMLESQAMWREHGPAAANLSVVGQLFVSILGDYRRGYLVSCHLLAVGEARSYEPETSLLRHRHALMVMPWNEPLENSIAQAQLAQENLLRAGDLQSAWAPLQILILLAVHLDSGRSLSNFADEIDVALRFANRTGNHFNNALLVTGRQLLRCLRGETASPGSFDQDSFSEEEYLSQASPLASAVFHTYRSVAAAVFGDTERLARHSSLAVEKRQFLIGYQLALVYLVQGLSLADRIRTAPAETLIDEIDSMRTELDECREWLAERAIDAPVNFQHLVDLIDAERAWAIDDFRSAARAFDAAGRGFDAGQRPWHQALIAERTACFYLSQGLQLIGQQSIIQARTFYRLWGASGKVEQLDRAYPQLRGSASTATNIGKSQHTASSTMRSEAIDMSAILRASQALGSETNLQRLWVVIVEQLSGLTGATHVVIAVQDHETGSWSLPPMISDEEPVPIEEAGQLGLLPISAFRYVERTLEPLLTDDAKVDHRFARDEYVSTLERCSLMVVPILEQGSARAVLMLSNQHDSGAFTSDRLDAVTLITGQLIVSLANATLYASLEQRVADRTSALAAANERLEALSNIDALTGLANRRRFDEALASEWERARRATETLSLLMIDVDHFKLFNDHYGHQAGDECLRQVAASLTADTRGGSDLACRYGGEEFAVILPRGDRADILAERIRAGIEGLNLPHLRSTTGTVTVSIGLATIVPSPNGQIQDLVKHADTALYEAKRNGRNRVEVYLPE